MKCNACKTNFEVSKEESRLLRRLGVPDPTLCRSCRVKERLAFRPYGNFYRRKCDLTGEAIISTFSPATTFPVYKRTAWYGDGWKPGEMEFDASKSFIEQFKTLQDKTPHFHLLGDEKSVNCDYCDDTWECKDCYFSRSMAKCEGLFYSYRNLNCKNCFEITFSFDSSESFHLINCLNCYHVVYAVNSRNCLDSSFLYDCRNCTNCFMCWNLRGKEYCIQNQKYSKEEYTQKIAALQTSSRRGTDSLLAEWWAHLQNDVAHRQDCNVQVENSTGNFLEKCKDCEDGAFVSEVDHAVNVFRGVSIKDSVDTLGEYRGEL
ncbi:MAG: hypothetical protein V1821_01715, partial [bacterium]